MKWETLKAAELSLMRNGQESEALGVDSIQERRRGGLCHRVEEFGGFIDRGEGLSGVKSGDVPLGEDGALGLSPLGLTARKFAETF